MASSGGLRTSTATIRLQSYWPQPLGTDRRPASLPKWLQNVGAIPLKNLTVEQGDSLIALEQHYTVAEVAAFLQVSDDTVRRIFSKIPSTLKIARPNGFKRKYTTLR